MKITYLHQYFNTPEMNGSTRSYEMARRWVALGHTVDMITSDRTGSSSPGWTEREIDGIHVHTLNVRYENSMSTSRRLRAFFSFAVKASTRARQVRGDVVFATSTPLTIIVPALAATVFRRTPIVFEVRDLWPELPIAMGRLRNPIARSAARLLESIAYKKSAKVVALSPGMAQGVINRGKAPSDVIVAPNSCDLEAFDVDPDLGNRYRKSQPWLGDRKFVVYCGTFGEINNVGYLVKVADEMGRLDATVAFGLYGSGRDSKLVEEMARDLGLLDVNVFLPGPVAKSEVPKILSAATVATSVFAPIPEMEANSANKFFDSLASRTPVVINYGGWQADLLKRSGAGISVSSTDPAIAAKRLAELLHDEDQLMRAASAASRLGRERFGRDAVSSIVLEVLESTLQDPGFESRV